MANQTQRVTLEFLLKNGNTITGMRAIEAESSKMAKKMSRMQQLANTETSRSYERLNSETQQGFRRNAVAREVLGIRSEKAIQREIRQTEAAYERLARSGQLSAREQTRAQDAMLRKVRELNNEMRTGTTLLNKFQGIATAGAAVLAGGYVVKRAADKAMSYEQRLALMANTAYAERDVAGRRAGMRDLESVINSAVRPGTGGGTREQAAEALDSMIARNVLGIDRSKSFLPTIMKTASGSGAEPLEIANLASVLVGQNIVSNDDQLKMAFNMITAAGQAGGFEIKDMSRWLSQQLPLAQKSGLMGLNGLQKVLTMNQAAILTAGTTDEAGNNVKNLLAKLNSSDTAKDFDRAGRGDLADFLMNQRLKGMDAVDAWMSIIDKEAASNPQMKTMLAKLKTSTDKGEQTQLLASLNAISEGTVVGKFFQDMQATGALLGLRNKSIVDKVNAEIGQNRTVTGVNDVNYAFMQTLPSVQVLAAEQAKDRATQAAMDGLTPTIGKVASQFEDLATKNPLLTGSTIVATTAITAMGGAAGLATLALRNKAAAESGGLITGGKMPNLKTAAWFAAGAGLSYVGSKDDSTFGRYGGSAINGAMLGGTIGSFIPVIGTGIGAAIGGAGGLAYEYMNSPSEPTKVDTTIRLELPEGMRVAQQTSNHKGPAKVWVETGSVWGIP